MDKEGMACIQALNTLQIDIGNITQDGIRKAYHRLCRQFHPDQYQNSGGYNQIAMKQNYIQVQDAYRLLTRYEMQTIVQYVNDYKMQCTFYNRQNQSGQVSSVPKRQARIFSSDREAMRLNRLQKEYQQDRKKEKESVRKSSLHVHQDSVSHNGTYEETMRKIGAIWIADIIHKQMEADKKKREKDNRVKLYKAFMQYQQNQREQLD